MEYSLNKRKISIGPEAGKDAYMPSLVCQHEQITFDQLCDYMAEDSTVGSADVAAVFYKFRAALLHFCSRGYIVQAGPLGRYRPRISTRMAKSIKEFNPATHITNVKVDYFPAKEFKHLTGIKFHRVEKKPIKKKSGTPTPPKP